MIEFEWKRLLAKIEAEPRFDVLRAELIALDGASFATAAGITTCTIATLSGTSAAGEAAALRDWAAAARRNLLSTGRKYLVVPAGDANLAQATLQQGGTWTGLTDGVAYHVFALADPQRIVPGAAPAPTAPAQFGPSDWSVSTGLAANQVVLNVSALPSNGGSAITALQYTIDGGTTWTALSGTGTGARTVTMAASGTAYTFALRAVNAVGNGTSSATKSATSGAATGPALRKDLIWLFGDSRTAFTSTTTGTAIETNFVGGDGGWAAILESLANNRFTILGKTATGGWNTGRAPERVAIQRRIHCYQQAAHGLV